ncbi:hypothetical protein Tco_1394309 [Tanacetum coccineum]
MGTQDLCCLAIFSTVDPSARQEAPSGHSTLNQFHLLRNKGSGRKTHDLDPLVSLVQELVTPSKTVNASGEEQVEDISPTTLEAAAILTKVQKIKIEGRVVPWKDVLLKICAKKAGRVNQEGQGSCTQLKKWNFDEVRSSFGEGFKQKLPKNAKGLMMKVLNTIEGHDIVRDKDDSQPRRLERGRKQNIKERIPFTDHDKDGNRRFRMKLIQFGVGKVNKDNFVGGSMMLPVQREFFELRVCRCLYANKEKVSFVCGSLQSYVGTRNFKEEKPG